MIIIEMNGGLGNQLQQYALYEKFKSLGRDAKLDISWYKSAPETAVNRKLELNYFPNVSYEICTAEEKQNILGNDNILSKVSRRLHLIENKRYTEHKMYDENLFKLENKVLTGYWACEAYYSDILPVLRQKLVFPASNNPANAEIKKQMAKTNAVSIHLRQGDYLTPQNRQMFGGICTDEYYKKAIAYMLQKVANAHFYVFSDDPDYARKFMEKAVGEWNLFSIKITPQENDIVKAADYGSSKYTIVDINYGKDSFYDIELMSCCKHHICANSTFSFWGARLNSQFGRIAIRPLKQKNGVDWYKPEEMKKLWSEWSCIDEEGKLWLS